jgi:hypothetical protein
VTWTCTVREARGKEGPGARAPPQDRGGGRGGGGRRLRRLRLPRAPREEEGPQGRRGGRRREEAPLLRLIDPSRIVVPPRVLRVRVRVISSAGRVVRAYVCMRSCDARISVAT